MAAPREQVTVLSLTSVTGLLRGPQYAMTSTSFWLHSALHAAASQLVRVTRTALSIGGDAALLAFPGCDKSIVIKLGILDRFRL